MIYIQKNSVNNFVLTLNENSHLSNPTYLFEFTNEYIINSTPIYWTQIDTSSYPNRYNLFELTENESGSTTGGTQNELSLISGQYKYNIYEATGSTLSVSATTGRIVESGRMVVAEENIITTITNNPNSIYY